MNIVFFSRVPLFIVFVIIIVNDQFLRESSRGRYTFPDYFQKIKCLEIVTDAADSNKRNLMKDLCFCWDLFYLVLLLVHQQVWLKVQLYLVHWKERKSQQKWCKQLKQACESRRFCLTQLRAPCKNPFLQRARDHPTASFVRHRTGVAACWSWTVSLTSLGVEHYFRCRISKRCILSD